MSESHQTLGIHAGDSAEHHIRRRPMMRRAGIAVIIILIVLALGALRTVIARVSNNHALSTQTDEQVRLYVNILSPKQATGAHTSDLPGTLQGQIESPIYARTNGYIVSWNKDIGGVVKKGDLLAIIATPEVDQQLSQAIAAQEQNASSLELAKTSFERWQALRKKDAVSQQELDERQSAYDQAQANYRAAEANTRRLQELEGFKRVVAPFDGVVTRRNIDVGDLIDAGSGGPRPLFTMAKADPLRVYIYVPQTDAERIKVGDTVQVTQAELPGQIFKGTIARTAGAIDTATRTLQVEISLPNPDNKLLPGAYVEVRTPTAGAPSLIVPINTLLFRAEGPRIAVVDANSKASLRAVRIGRDYGETLEIVEGLDANDRVIVNPADSIVDGQPVTVVPSQAPNTPQPGASTGEQPGQGQNTDQSKSKDKDKGKKPDTKSVASPGAK